MKYALFEFCNEKACEIGEARWILREDPENFRNDGWDTGKEVMVAWPTEFVKISKKIVKSSIDPSLVSTTTCVARVLKFSDDYETIRKHMKRYIETGCTTTPNHGRGHRTSKKNVRYFESDMEEGQEREKTPKRQRRFTTTAHELKNPSAIDTLKAKYNLMEEKIANQTMYNESEDDDNNTICEDDELEGLKEENSKLKKQLGEKNKEIENLHCIINSMKEIQHLPDIVSDLKEQVERMKDRNSRSCSPASPLQCKGDTASVTSSATSSTDSDNETDLVSIGPEVAITKAQFKVVKSKRDLKDYMYVYSIMGMIWSREVICTHSLTGKASNAFKDKDAKPQLDKAKVQTICDYGSKMFGVKPDEVRKMMITRINNIVKVEKAKEKQCQLNN